MNAHKQNGNKLEQAPSNSTLVERERVQQRHSTTDQTYSVVSQLTPRRVNRSFWTIGGFKVEVVVDVYHIKARLKGEREGGG